MLARLALLGTVLAALTNAAPAFADCKPLQPIVSLPMTRLRNNALTIPVTLMGRPSSLLLDTGGAVRSLSTRVVQELGLKPFYSDIRLYDLRGKSRQQEVIVPSITFAGHKLTNVGFLIEPDDAFTDQNGHAGFDGIFAPDLFPHSDFDIDSGAMRFTLFSEDHCPGKVVYWSSPAVAVIPFEVTQGRKISFPVKVDGKPLQAILDTGASMTAMNLDVARSRFKVDVNAPDVERVGKFTDSKLVYRRRFESLSLEGIEIKNPLIDLIPDMSRTDMMTGSHTLTDSSKAMPDLLFGESLISKLHIYVAYKEHKLYVSGVTPAPRPTSSPQGPASTDCKPPETLLSMPLKRLPSGRVTLAATLGDRPAMLLLDTGHASPTLLPKTVNDFRPASATQTAQSERTVVPTVTLGDMKLNDMSFAVASDDLARLEPTIDGFFTPNFVQDTDVDIDVRAQTLKLVSTDHCAGIGAVNGTPVTAVPYSIDGDGKILLTVRLDGKELPAALNLGDGFTGIDSATAQRLFGVVSKGSDLGEAGKERKVFHTQTFSALAIGRFTIRNPVVALFPDMLGPPSPTNGGQESGRPEILLGMNALRNVRVYIATKEHKLYLAPSAAQPPPTAAPNPAPDASHQP